VVSPPSRQTSVAPSVTATSTISAAAIAVGDRAADRAARPRRAVADIGHHLGEQRQLGADNGSLSTTHCLVVAPIATCSPSSRMKRGPESARCRSAASAAPAASPSAAPASARRRSRARRRRPRAARRPRRCRRPRIFKWSRLHRLRTTRR
jgi:hypothetical protein